MVGILKHHPNEFTCVNLYWDFCRYFEKDILLMWSVCVATVIEFYWKTMFHQRAEDRSSNEQEDSSTNEQEDSSANEEGLVSGEKSPQLREHHSSWISREIKHLMSKEECKW